MMKKAHTFSRRGPDRVAEEIATVLAKEASFEFKALFSVVHANLKASNSASGGEEMLRLRAYEKLQTFVRTGIVKKVGKEYRGVSSGIETYLAAATAQNEKCAADRLQRKSGIPATAPHPTNDPSLN
jgi:hypothetical protein